METKDFPDHHIYTESDLRELGVIKNKYGAEAMITTEKDAVKLKDIATDKDEIYALKLKPSLDLKGLMDEQ